MINFTDYSIEMWDDEKIASFRRTLLAWYDNEKRDLPWRRTKNPYHIWVSEIMLQQTQVVTVIPYYERFLAWFPTVDALAKAPEEKLLKAWEGLGYYSRVRNMQKAAQEIMDDFNGEFPSTYDDILSLKGIGPYTAGAIASIAFDLPEPAVDGNVMRVMARLFEVNYDIGDPKNRKIFQAIMEVLIDLNALGISIKHLWIWAQILSLLKILAQMNHQFAFSAQLIYTALMTNTLSNCQRKSQNRCKFKLLSFATAKVISY